MAIEDEVVEGLREDGQGLELIGLELMIHRTIQQTIPAHSEGLQIQPASAVPALVTPMRPSRASPRTATTMAAAEAAEGTGLGESIGGNQELMTFPAGPPITYGPVGGSQGVQDMSPLFTQDQLRRLHDLQQQAPYLYQKRTGKGVGDGERTRPPFLAPEGGGMEGSSIRGQRSSQGLAGSSRLEKNQLDLQLLHRHRDQLLEENRRMEEHNNLSREENRRWWEENQRLRAENAALRFRLTMTDVQNGRSENEDPIYQTPDRGEDSASVDVVTNVRVLENNEVPKYEAVARFDEA